MKNKEEPHRLQCKGIIAEDVWVVKQRLRRKGCQVNLDLGHHLYIAFLLKGSDSPYIPVVKPGLLLDVGSGPKFSADVVGQLTNPFT